MYHSEAAVIFCYFESFFLLKKLHPVAHTDRQTHIQADEDGDSMTNSAQRGRVGEKKEKK